MTEDQWSYDAAAADLAAVAAAASAAAAAVSAAGAAVAAELTAAELTASAELTVAAAEFQQTHLQHSFLTLMMNAQQGYPGQQCQVHQLVCLAAQQGYHAQHAQEGQHAQLVSVAGKDGHNLLLVTGTVLTERSWIPAWFLVDS